MPPRKKASTDGSAPAAPTRTSARNAAKAAAAASATPPAAPAPAPAKSKSKGKRARASSDDEDEAPPSKPASKKAKKAKTTDDADVDDEDATNDKKDDKKMVTVLKRGAAPVDPRSGKVDTHQVYSNAEGIWDAMLNQTDVGDNKNKFYVLQLLHPVGNDSSCVLYTRWGRVGENGQSMNKGPFPPATAVNEFKKQFKSKAGVNWEQRVGMVPKKGKYVWLERNFDDEEEDDKAEGSSGKPKSSKEDIVIPNSKLHPALQEFARLIFNTSYIDATLSSMNYDANKLPLGKLSKATILKGFAALKSLSEAISDPNSDIVKEHGTVQRACEALSNQYYSIIPHVSGRNRLPIISAEPHLKKELELVDALGDMEITSELISSTSSHLLDEDGNPLNPLDHQFRSLALTKMEPLDHKSKEFEVLAAYARDTHGHTHSHIKANVKQIYRVERGSETDAFTKAGYDSLPDGERMLLWHGSRSTNFAGILKQGLRIAPPEAPVNGYMFGKGVYFADMMSKSAGYCYPSMSGGIGILLLCEVAVKPFYELYNAEYNAAENCKQNGKRATKGLGRTQPPKWKDAGEATGDDELIGCHMPDGGGENVDHEGYLQYNEYIVYDVSQIRVRYLFMIKM
ncbi:PARP-domain-containing protein [Dendrothele bispora CBS 962.96]|uniref:Poly [ADP-ribose] polymerase n=1 Tax=Dendrothele bispora (strain CBS 962.96) TaxID=1314807 RepID=A0A4S8LFJ0_DENBC|nr:PARP-domain-containing protein [Dendrothele bispora CBS 962.96]